MNLHATPSVPSTDAARQTPAPVVRLRGVSKRYADGPAVLDGVDLEIFPGAAVAIIGPNGTGKSTLLRMLTRLVEPSGGGIDVLGQDVTTLRRHALSRLRARVGFVFQRHNLVTRLSALSNVVHGVQSRMSGPRTWHQALAPAFVRADALECLHQVGMAEKALARADTLSGGQSQRVAIARMLMQRPELVIADEPDASLDPKAGEEVMQLLFDLSKAKGLTLIFVSHRLEHTLRFSDRIIGLGEGRVALDAPAASLDEPKLRTFFDA